jgi:putative NADH-flavin reductase
LAIGADAIVLSVSAKSPDKTPENSLLVKITENVQQAFSQLETKPYIVQIGGANLMYGNTYEEVKENMQDAPFSFEKGTSMHAVLFGHQISLEMYQASKLSWTIIAPPMKILGIYKGIDKTTRKENYRISTSEALVDEEGNKTIYVRDLANAVINEIENKKFDRQVFTVGY